MTREEMKKVADASWGDQSGVRSGRPDLRPHAPCRVCGRRTLVVVNIDFKAVPVCNPCCLAITKQTVAAMNVSSLESCQ